MHPTPTRHFPDPAAAPHLPVRARSVTGVMALVLLALVPGVVAKTVLFGPGTLVQITLAVVFALVFEAAMLRLRGRPLAPAIGDLSAPTAAVLFALCLPPLAPWWIAAVGMAAAMVFAKHLYGGLGHNLFNPAMVGYAVVLVGFPLELSQWLPPDGLAAAPGLGETLAIVFGASPAGGFDAITAATPLEVLREQVRAGATLSEVRSEPVFGPLGGRGWAWVGAMYLLGGIALIALRVIPWQVPVAVIGGVVLLSTPMWLLEADVHPAPLQHLFMGGFLLAAFFIATEPVSGCTTPRGRLVFGLGVAVVTLAVRRWGAYPDGIAFGVLLMNALAPWIDRYSRPRIHGEAHGRASRGPAP